MRLAVHLPEELARRVQVVAAEHHQSPEQVAIDAIDAQLPSPPVPSCRRLAFAGIAASTSERGAVAAAEMLAEGLRARLRAVGRRGYRRCLTSP